MKWIRANVGLCLAVASAQALTFEEAHRRAQQENPTFQVLTAEISAAEGAQLDAGARANPELTVNPGFKRSFGEGGSGTQFQGELGISQTFEFPGKRALRLHLASGEVKLRQIAVEGFRQQLRTTVRKAFCQALLAKQVATLRAEQLESAETFLKAARKRIENGYASDFELVKAQVDRIAAKREQGQASGELRAAKLQLAALMGAPTDTMFEVEGLLDSTVVGTAPADPTAFAMANHPGIRAQSLQVELAQSAVEAARLGSNPDLTVNPVMGVSRDEQSIGIGLTVPLPLWNRGKGNVAVANASQRRAQAELERLRQEIRQSVQSSQERIRRAEEELSLYTPEFLEELKNTMVRAEKVYAQNATSLLIYLEARRNRFDALSGYYEALGQRAQGLLELESAMGASPEPIILNKGNK
jgi:outer membrane protein, heavy metal efflux system